MRWVQNLHVWSSDTAGPGNWEAAGLEGALWLFLFCGDRNLVWVQLIAQSAIYTDFLSLWKALRYCSHLDLGAQTPLGPELVAVQVVIQRVASDEHLLLRAPGCAEPSGQLPPHPRCLSEVQAAGLLPCPAFREGGQPGPAPFPSLLSLSTSKPSFSPSGAQGRQSQACSKISRLVSATDLWATLGGQSRSQTEPWQAGLESAGRAGLQPLKTPLSLSRAGQQICDSFVTGKAQPYCNLELACK